MQIAVRILANTPLWVFALLAYLIWQGSQALRVRTQPIWRMLIIPLVFFLMGLSRLILARDKRAGAASRMAGGGAVVCVVGGFPQASATGGGQKKPHRDPSGQRHAAGSQHHGLRAAIRGRGRDRHEARTACRR